MKTKEEILKEYKVIDKSKYCVYALIKDDEIIYIGQTNGIEHRINFHNRIKEFDCYSIIEKDLTEVESVELETEYIIKFRPILNKAIRSTSKYKTKKALRHHFNVGSNVIENIIEYNGIKRVYFNIYLVSEVGKFIE